MRASAKLFAEGKAVRRPPRSLSDYALLQKLPGYTRAELYAEPAEVVEDWLAYMAAEAEVQDRGSRKKGK